MSKDALASRLVFGWISTNYWQTKYVGSTFAACVEKAQVVNLHQGARNMLRDKKAILSR